ncbi:ABC transporter substrate-binding protein [Kurthia zopfii]|uniref:Hydroxymethylpyrimidine transport system substrate-binding protein n=2 Tax=Kurthia zopfii TaxID=1650 RepID=A0A2U3AB23_9BACL|nr:ABC transporter substrate-binding protein [Kurthia zopfii]PWI21749.1 ABC transporter substrate-binding protein [Kurthia zopfii]TDR35813.1 putative hydroxymethylpyrimidine transport system substrate-binding protein [Kurthia zopfii]STX09717.1 Putative thiamine biosynthesis protein HI_0357 [Kurthia zopfii]VEI06977.1 Putative thiamine biosynthesis protein HI_0357 [Kurthia zopfii]
MKLMKWLSTLMIAVLILSGCSSTAKKDENGKELKEVNVMLDWYPNAIHSFLYVAIEKGYFKDAGLDVKLQFPSNPTDPLTLTAAGKTTLGIYYQQDVIVAKANEQVPITSVGPVVRTPLNQLMSLEESNIKRPKDLEGKTVGYSGTPLSEATIKFMVEHDGGDPSKVKLVDVGFELVSALITKKVDVISGGMINHELPVMEHKGYKIATMDSSKFGVPKSREMVFVAGDKTLAKDQETVTAFLKAAEKGFDFTKKHPEESLDLLLENQEKESFPLTKAIEEQSLDILLKHMETKDEPFLSDTKEAWDEQTKWLLEQKMIQETIPSDQLYKDLVNYSPLS